MAKKRLFKWGAPCIDKCFSITVLSTFLDDRDDEDEDEEEEEEEDFEMDSFKDHDDVDDEVLFVDAGQEDVEGCVNLRMRNYTCIPQVLRMFE